MIMADILLLIYSGSYNFIIKLCFIKYFLFIVTFCSILSYAIPLASSRMLSLNRFLYLQFLYGLSNSHNIQTFLCIQFICNLQSLCGFVLICLFKLSPQENLILHFSHSKSVIPTQTAFVCFLEKYFFPNLFFTFFAFEFFYPHVNCFICQVIISFLETLLVHFSHLISTNVYFSEWALLKYFVKLPIRMLLG